MNCSTLDFGKSFVISMWFAIAVLVTAVSGQRDSVELTWDKLDSKTDASFRGLSVVDDQTFWVSGSKGTVLRSTNGGKTLENVSVPNCEKLDFRDVHAFDAKNAVVMNAGTPGVFYRTADAGKSWRKVYDDRRPEVFFDAMDFWNDKSGIAFGDAIKGRMCIVVTSDGGRTWREIDRKLQPEMQEGEGGFAASGTCLITLSFMDVLIGTGSHVEGKSDKFSRILISDDTGLFWTSKNVPIPRNQSSGIFSLCWVNGGTLVAVGGDYTKPDVQENNFAISQDGGLTWTAPSKNTEGNLPSG